MNRHGLTMYMVSIPHSKMYGQRVFCRFSMSVAASDFLLLKSFESIWIEVVFS